MKNGYVTVFFSLLISVSMSLILLFISGIRENAVRMRIREVMETAVHSIYGEYNRYLWDKYGLVFVDCGYESGINSTVIVEDHLTRCMNENFSEGGLELLGERDLLKLKCEGAEVEKIRFATDENGAEIINQAVEYMKYSTQIELISKIYNEILDYDDTSLEKEEIMTKYHNAKSFVGNEKDAIFSEVNLSADNVFWDKNEKVSSLSILNLIVEDTSSISTASFDDKSLYSNRLCNKGNYGVSKKGSFLDKALFREYLISILSNYREGKEDSCLSYELEYMIAGNEDEQNNLESVLYKLLLVREGANYISFKKDKAKTDSVHTVALIISSLVGNPELTEPISDLLMAVWVSSESISDVKHILAGEKRPFIKEPTEWETGLSANELFTKETKEYDKGLDYCDYLRMFLISENDDVLVSRLINVIEINVRENTEEEIFRFDTCFDACEITGYVSDGYSDKFIITRSYDSYENFVR